jgi:hypothetical protein
MFNTLQELEYGLQSPSQILGRFLKNVKVLANGRRIVLVKRTDSAYPSISQHLNIFEEAT